MFRLNNFFLPVFLIFSVIFSISLSQAATCQEQNLMSFDACTSSCIQAQQGTCVESGRNDQGVACFRCDVPKVKPCPYGYNKGRCNPYRCAEGVQCNQIEHNGNKCFVCGEAPEIDEDSCSHVAGWPDSGCYGKCSTNQQCALDTLANDNMDCYVCQDKPQEDKTEIPSENLTADGYDRDNFSSDDPAGDGKLSCADRFDMNLDQCRENCGSKGKHCWPEGEDDYGNKCYKCKDYEKESCSDYDLKYACRECPQDTYCHSVHRNSTGTCYDCKTQDNVCLLDDEKFGPCHGTCSDEELCYQGISSSYIQNGEDVQVSCHKCMDAKDPESFGCSKGKYQDRQCNGQCDENQVCLDVTISPFQYFNDQRRGGSFGGYGSSYDDHPDKGQCYRCVDQPQPIEEPVEEEKEDIKIGEEIDFDRTCDQFNLYDSCGDCPPETPECLYERIDGYGTCHRCVEKLECKHYEYVDQCSQCPEGDGCNMVRADTSVDGGGEMLTCYECISKSICEEHGAVVDCSFCADDEECKTEFVGPHDNRVECKKCVKKERHEFDTCEYYEAVPNCTHCDEGLECVPANLWKSNLRCYYCQVPNGCESIGKMAESRCDFCREEMGGQCVPSVKAPNGDQCYACQSEISICEDLHMGLYTGGCGGECSADEKCVPRRVNDLSCYECVSTDSGESSDSNDRGGIRMHPALTVSGMDFTKNTDDFITVEVTWVVVVIETPFGRVTLDRNDNESIFSPKSILSLASLDSVSSLFDTSSATVGKAEDIANMLKDTIGQSHRGVGEDCFENLQTATPKTSEPTESSFGTNPEDNIVTDGPMVSCGRQNGEDVLQVFDSSGGLIQSISSSLLQSQPSSLVDALQQASNVSQKIKAMTPRRSSSFTAEPAGSGYPNDVLYKFSKKKNREISNLLGIKRKSKKIGIRNEFSADAAIRETLNRNASRKNVYEQWGLHQAGYLPTSDKNSAWNIVSGQSRNVTVAVIDSGLDMTHPDGPEYVWQNEQEIPGNGVDDDGNGYVDDVNGWNFVDENNDLTDLFGHGTFVTGIIAAKTNNGEGMAGINPGAVIMPLKVVTEDGEINSLAVARAIRYAVDQGAHLINASLGGNGLSKLEQSALNYARENGVYVVISSGNTGDYLGNFGPAGAKRVTTVGAINMDGSYSTISSWGPNNGLVGPGELIISTKSTQIPSRKSKSKLQYGGKNGTSFSAPMVAATASLMLVKNPSLTPEQIEAILLGTARDMEEKGWDGKTGAGSLDATAALRAVNQDFVNVKVTRVVVNQNKRKKVESVDVYGLVQGDIQSFEVGLGRGERARRFKTVAGPFSNQADYDWVARIPGKRFNGSDNWKIQIKARGSDGETYQAESLLNIDR